MTFTAIKVKNAKKYILPDVLAVFNPTLRISLHHIYLLKPS